MTVRRTILLGSLSVLLVVGVLVWRTLAYVPYETRVKRSVWAITVAATNAYHAKIYAGRGTSISEIEEIIREISPKDGWNNSLECRILSIEAARF